MNDTTPRYIKVGDALSQLLVPSWRVWPLSKVCSTALSRRLKQLKQWLLSKRSTCASLCKPQAC